MPAKKKPAAALAARLRKAALKAHQEGRWETAIANYTRALDSKPLSAEARIELLQGIAASYRKKKDLKAEAAVLKTISDLLKAENDRLLAESAQRDAELAILNSVQAALARELDIQGIYEVVGETVKEIFDAQGIGLFIYDPETKLLHSRYMSNLVSGS